jgi:hypothetical protein
MGHTECNVYSALTRGLRELGDPYSWTPPPLTAPAPAPEAAEAEWRVREAQMFLDLDFIFFCFCPTSPRLAAPQDCAAPPPSDDALIVVGAYRRACATFI